MLHEYQIQVANEARERERCALFLDMGLGKTAIILKTVSDIIESNPGTRFIVIAPPALVLHSWPVEIEKFAPHLRYLNEFNRPKYTPTRRLQVYHEALEHDLLLVSYSLVLKFCEWGVIRGYQGLVIDESTKFKGYKNKTFAQLRKTLGHFRYRYIMTGTPIPNGHADLYNQIYLLDEGEALGSTYFTFRNRYFTKDPWNRFSYSPRPGAESEITEKVAPYIIRRGVECLPSELPTFISTVQQHRPLPWDLAEAYRTLKKQYMLSITSVGDPSKPTETLKTEPVSQNNGSPLVTGDPTAQEPPQAEETLILAKTEAELANKLIQFCSGAIYLNPGCPEWSKIHDVKLEMLDEVLQNYPGRILLAYNYKHEAQRIQEHLGAQVIAFNLRTMGTDLHRWEQSDGTSDRVLMAHPGSIGHGVNLQHACSVIVWFGFTYNLEHYLQFNKRLHRQGQRYSVRCIHLAVGDIEYKLLNKLKTKDLTQQALLDYMRVCATEPTYHGFTC